MDSSWWIEYFLNTIDNAMALVIEDFSKLYVPTIVIYEVFKKLLADSTEETAKAAVMQMSKGIVVDLDDRLALYAVRISREHKLPMADSIIYATTLQHNATLWTQDKHFEGLSHVRYSPKSV
jgi:predicted nucleic acid-binding protein